MCFYRGTFSFSPSMEVHLLDEDFRTTGIGQVDDLCQLENILQFEFRTKGFDLFKKPHRNLSMYILTFMLSVSYMYRM